AWWRAPVVPATQEAEAGEWREPGRWSLQGKVWKTLTPISALSPQVQVDSNTISRQDKAPPPPVVSQQQSRSLKEECPAGFYRSEHTRACNPCTQGVEYTNASNSEPSCLPCAVCKSGTECMSPCTTTSNTVCQCKPGSFRNGNSTEMCRKCSIPEPLGSLEPAVAPPGPSACPNPYSLWQPLPIPSLTRVPLASRALGVDLSGLFAFPRSFSGVHVLHEFMSLHGTEDNAHNETLSTRFLQPQVSEQEIEGQEPAEPTGVTVQSPEEPQRLLEQAEAEACQRRTLPVPVNGADPTEINTLLDASATLEEGHAKETIQDHMVDSEKLFYEEDDAGFATSSL
uniref:TNFR-Cys domain-containing protein n=1 Tax=Rhinopithecus bieti TaxID=61621 RepID=A0A2K6MM25_RHIBE